MLMDKLSLLTANLRLLPPWVYPAYIVTLGAMLVWHFNLRPSQGFTAVVPSVLLIVGGVIHTVILARIIQAGVSQSVLMPLTVALGGLMPILIGVFFWNESASAWAIACRFGAVLLIVISTLV